MPRPSPLDDKHTAAHAWARFGRLMKGLALLTAAIILLAFAFVWWSGEPVSYHFYIALALGIGMTMMLTGALMSLIFLSSGTGHDEAIEDPLEEARRPKSYWQD